MTKKEFVNKINEYYKLCGDYKTFNEHTQIAWRTLQCYKLGARIPTTPWLRVAIINYIEWKLS